MRTQTQKRPPCKHTSRLAHTDARMGGFAELTPGAPHHVLELPEAPGPGQKPLDRLRELPDRAGELPGRVGEFPDSRTGCDGQNTARLLHPGRLKLVPFRVQHCPGLPQGDLVLGTSNSVGAWPFHLQQLTLKCKDRSTSGGLRNKKQITPEKNPIRQRKSGRECCAGHNGAEPGNPVVNAAPAIGARNSASNLSGSSRTPTEYL